MSQAYAPNKSADNKNPTPADPGGSPGSSKGKVIDKRKQLFVYLYLANDEKKILYLLRHCRSCREYQEKGSNCGVSSKQAGKLDGGANRVFELFKENSLKFIATFRGNI